MWVIMWCVLGFFFKQKTAYEWRISDWSSDVCSSDLFRRNPRRPTGGWGDAGEKGSRWVSIGLPVARPASGARRNPSLRRDSNARPVTVNEDRKTVVWGKRVSIRGDTGGRRTTQNKKNIGSHDNNAKTFPKYTY